MNWYIAVLKNYVGFSGRARRKEYWMFFLFNIIVSFVLAGIDMALGMQFLYSIYSLAVLLPSIAVAIRRMHDTGRTGWWILINFIPLIGFIIFIIFACQDSEPGSNDYGPNPKEV